VRGPPDVKLAKEKERGGDIAFASWPLSVGGKERQPLREETPKNGNVTVYFSPVPILR